MELVPQEGLPRSQKTLGRIFGRAKPCRHHGSFLRGIRKQLILTVPPLADGMGGHRAGAVRNQKFAVICWKCLAFLRCQIVEQLVGGSSNDFIESVLFIVHCIVDHLCGNFLAGAAVVTGSVVHGTNGMTGIFLVVLDLLQIFFTLIDRTGIAFFIEIIGIITLQEGCRHEFSVGTNPLAKIHARLLIFFRKPLVRIGKRILFLRHRLGNRSILLIDRASHAPDQLLGGETVKTHVRRDGRKGIAETEAVCQKDVSTFLSEFLFEIAVSIENLSHQGFRRRHVGIHGIPCGSGNAPAAFCNVFL